ncbi:MAG: hypothetical protein J2P36_12330 [Ktedonobacteraceae bacterium]|nr:hypothetical protein [Ktedonobacteraceae bacterium]
MEEVREKAKQWATKALHFDEPFATMIHEYIDEMPLTLEGMPYCPACESILCGACGDCHSFDLRINDPICPKDHDTMGQDCVAWWQALKSVITVQRMMDEGPFN